MSTLALRRWDRKPPMGTGLRWEHPLMHGIVGYWPFQDMGASGTGLNKRTLNVVNKQRHGTVAPTAGRYPVWRGGGRLAGPSLLFDPSSVLDGTIQIGNPSDFGAGNAARSMYILIEFRSVPSNSTSIFTIANGAGTNAGIQIAASSGGVLESAIFGGIGIINGPTAIANKVYSLLTTWDGTTRRFFVDGVQQGTDTTAIGTGTIDSVYISTYDGGSEPILNAHVYQAAAWNRALSASQARDLKVDPWLLFQPPLDVSWMQTAAAAGGTTNWGTWCDAMHWNRAVQVS